MSLPLALLLLGGGLVSPGDTLLDVREGDRLLLHDLGGVVIVDGWEESHIEAEAYREDGRAISFQRRGSRILASMDGRGGRDDVEIRVRVPHWLAIEVSGRDLDVAVRSLEADLSVHTLSGTVRLDGLSGTVEVYATDGEVEASGLDGSARIRTGDADVQVWDSEGSLEIETVDGEIQLEGIESSAVTVRSTDGEIEFEGRFLSGGDYGFYSHGGNITFRLAPPLNIKARILAYGGEFGSDFPVRATSFRSGEGMEFTMGTGGATLTVESFRGDVRFRDRRTPVIEPSKQFFGPIPNDQGGAG